MEFHIVQLRRVNESTCSVLLPLQWRHGRYVIYHLNFSVAICFWVRAVKIQIWSHYFGLIIKYLRIYILYYLFLACCSELDPRLSGLVWAAMLISLAIVITLPRPSGIRTFIASTILRLIFSVGLEPTLYLLGTLNVSLDFKIRNMSGAFSFTLSGIHKRFDKSNKLFVFKVPKRLALQKFVLLIWDKTWLLRRYWTESCI